MKIKENSDLQIRWGGLDEAALKKASMVEDTTQAGSSTPPHLKDQSMKELFHLPLHLNLNS